MQIILRLKRKLWFVTKLQPSEFGSIKDELKIIKWRKFTVRDPELKSERRETDLQKIMSHLNHPCIVVNYYVFKKTQSVWYIYYLWIGNLLNYGDDNKTVVIKWCCLEINRSILEIRISYDSITLDYTYWITSKTQEQLCQCHKTRAGFKNTRLKTKWFSHGVCVSPFTVWKS